ncbi:trypsin-like cysteine/serine peptidase domain-containing protein [Baffinella frigidus]|nr:trypsin-like cysteine/serine peptidase domain-containing protein [Cryptophyta sp. CCMP2293]
MLGQAVRSTLRTWTPQAVRARSTIPAAAASRCPALIAPSSPRFRLASRSAPQGAGARGRALSAGFPPPGVEEAIGDPQTDLSTSFNSVIKVFTVAASPNWFMPWQTKQQRESTGSGFIIEGRRILTNAHCVADQAHVMIRKHGDPTKYTARVVAVGHECDLALLTTDSEEFWKGTTSLKVSGIPELQDPVAVVGYPTGGDNISVSVGVVSRVEPQQYVHGATSLLAIQIDAAINPGNSGGPAIMNNEVVGVAFQSLEGAENIGFIIPVPIINHFLEDVERNQGNYVGFPALGISCQAMENPQMRKFFKMKPDENGVLICKVRPLTDAAKLLKKHDVILQVDGQSLGNDGTVLFRNRERISFDYVLSGKFAGDKVDIVLLRDGERQTITIEAQPLKHLVPIQQYDLLPRYLIHAGLVFTPLSQPYLHEYGDDWYNTSPRRLCERALFLEQQREGQELVILSQVASPSYIPARETYITERETERKTYINTKRDVY